MELGPKTIEEHIDCLARLTGAPETFVFQVKNLFSMKGIELEADATPYLNALDEAFRREETIRSRSARAHEQITRMQTRFNDLGQSYGRQLDQLKKMQADLRERTERLGGARTKASRSPRSPRTSHVTVPGDHRTFVTRPQLERMPLVPGPKEPQ